MKIAGRFGAKPRLGPTMHADRDYDRAGHTGEPHARDSVECDLLSDLPSGHLSDLLCDLRQR